jgi:hypothetical protein
MKIQLTNTDVQTAIRNFIKEQLPAFASQEIALEYTLSRGAMPQLTIDLHIGADAQVFLDSRAKAFTGSGEAAPTAAVIGAAVTRNPRTVAPKVKAEEQLDLEVVEEEEVEETTEAVAPTEEVVEAEVEETPKPARRAFARKV